ncbi:hypothetical protein GCM10012289_35340 [Nonomuraea cavernae]|uniref:FAD-binding domain-containing protein n=1 Tax=Nonomuraea cavernae TaxID=2045107 RepID=A0A917YZU4_9ACTN|nr:hypothetical protein GCM10012289_35340 [Nonomuraea cavernae]
MLDVWSAVGAGRIAEEGLTWTAARTYYRDRELSSWRFEVSGTLPPFVNISQSRTEEILDEAIAAQPLVEVRWGHEVTGPERDDHGVTVRCGARSLRASYVVACAGAREQGLREALGVRFDGRTFALEAGLRAERLGSRGTPGDVPRRAARGRAGEPGGHRGHHALPRPVGRGRPGTQAGAAGREIA